MWPWRGFQGHFCKNHSAVPQGAILLRGGRGGAAEENKHPLCTALSLGHHSHHHPSQHICQPPPPSPSEGAAAPKPHSDGGTGGPGQLLLCIPSSWARASPSPPCWPKRCFGVKRGHLGWDPGGGHISGVTAQGTEQSGLQQLPLEQEEAPAEPTAAQTEQHPHGFSCLPAPLHQLAEPGIVPKHRGEQMVRADGRTRHSSPNYTNKYA